MPKASSSTTTLSTPAITAANILKRNQACHQCRRRKLKCDARRPCATCIRSHANARAQAGAASVPPEPECTYDEIPEPRPQSQDPPKNRYERLEGRINELEQMLRQKESYLPAPHPTPYLSLNSDGMSHAFMSPNGSSNDLTQSFGVTDYRPSPGPSGFSLTPDPGPSNGAMASSTSISSIGATRSMSRSRNNSHPSPPTAATNSPPQDADLFRDLFWPSWPARLPTPELLHHLVEVFFASLPHATRVLHQESFVASLSLPPTTAEFPETSILHAICAVASLFTPVIAPPPLPNLNERPAGKILPLWTLAIAKCETDEIFQEKYRRTENRDDSFGEMQAKYAKEAQDESAMVGEGLFAGLQSVVILSWYYFYHARWVDVWLTTGEALRYCVPLFLNVCEPQVPLIRSWKTRPTIIPPSRTAIEEETRRNTFWLAYALDRFHASGNEFAMTLDDEDITQVMPCLSHEFKNGISIPTGQRQRLTTPRMLTTHPPEQTDSFVLYVKSTVLLSKVKIFNLRYKSKFQAGGPPGQGPGPGPQSAVDPRESPAFKGLDSTIASFKMSFPREFRDPIPNGVVDPHLYVAHLIPHTATLLLHDPHADFGLPDRSSEKLSVAAHAILDLVYLICSTSYDITLLDPAVMWCWYTAAQELVREMQHMRQTAQAAQAAVLRSEIEVIRLALVRLGERLPLGYRQTKVLDDLLAQEVPDFNLESAAYESQYPLSGLEEVDPGSLEQLMYDGMR
ncbi:hypothetical protein K439DRAFT_1401652 [Ramaria rubella]|nr:hypothetical protein K439DRAFT_1401652 [Ramaria rubella]